MFNNGWITQVKLNYEQQNGFLISQPMVNWLCDFIGPQYNKWYYDDSLNRIFFTTEEDQVKFILKWM